MQNMSVLYQARALYYDFFAGFFLYELISVRKDLFITQLDILAKSPINEQDSEYFTMLRAYLTKVSTQSLLQEYTQIFNLPFNSHNLPKLSSGNRKKNKIKLPNPQIFLYLSHYLEGCLNGESLLKIRTLVKKTHFRLNAKEFKESEEHFGFLLLLMRFLLQDSDSNLDSLKIANEIFTQAITPMALPIANALIQRNDLACYYFVGLLLKSFISLEEQIKN